MARKAHLRAWLSSALLLAPLQVFSQANVSPRDLGLASAVLVQLGAPSASSFCSKYLGARPTPTVTATVQGALTTGATTVSTTVTLDAATTTSVASTTTLSIQTTWVRGTTTLPLTSTAISTIVSETTPSTTVYDTTTIESYPSTTRYVVVTETTTIAARRKARRAAATPIILPKRLQVFSPPVISAACSPYAPSPATVTRTSNRYTTTIGANTRTVVVTNTPPAAVVRVTSTLTTVQLFTSTSTSTSYAYETSTTRTTLTAPAFITNEPITTQTLISGTSTVSATVTRQLYTSVPTFCLSSSGLSDRSGGTPRRPIWEGSSSDWDDDTKNINLPFQAQIYDRLSSIITISTNGVLGIGNTGTSFTEEALPYNRFDRAVFFFWDDLYVLGGTTQAIYYATTPTTLVLEYLVTHFDAYGEYYHFLVTYDTANPGVWTTRYLAVSDGGSSCLVGAQAGGDPASTFVQLGIDVPNLVNAGDVVEINTFTNSIQRSEFDGRCSADLY